MRSAAQAQASTAARGAVTVATDALDEPLTDQESTLYCGSVDEFVLE